MFKGNRESSLHSLNSYITCFQLKNVVLKNLSGAITESNCYMQVSLRWSYAVKNSFDSQYNFRIFTAKFFFLQKWFLEFAIKYEFQIILWHIMLNFNFIFLNLWDLLLLLPCKRKNSLKIRKLHCENTKISFSEFKNIKNSKALAKTAN